MIKIQIFAYKQPELFYWEFSLKLQGFTKNNDFCPFTITIFRSSWPMVTFRPSSGQSRPSPFSTVTSKDGEEQWRTVRIIILKSTSPPFAERLHERFRPEKLRSCHEKVVRNGQERMQNYFHVYTSKMKETANLLARMLETPNPLSKR